MLMNIPRANPARVSAERIDDITRGLSDFEPSAVPAKEPSAVPNNKPQALRRLLKQLWAAYLGLAAATAAAAGQSTGAGLAGVEILRTADGIPHIRAGNWRDLGYGYGYAQAQDALCTLAEAFTTFEGRRSFFFGPQSRPRAPSTFGRPLNIELDFFFRLFATADRVAEYRRHQPEGLNRLIDGFAAGYNGYLREVRRQGADHTCLGEAWVREITADDIIRRLYAVNLAAGYAKFIPEIVNAAPPAVAARPAGRTALDLRRRLANSLGEEPGLGSNVIALGGQATGVPSAVLFGNPHWFWSGPDRFYQAHLTIPGLVDVAGVSFLGVPVIMLGFNTHVAWSHTVSEARRFGLFELALDAGEQTAYRYDDSIEAMHPVRVSVETRGEKGKVIPLTRALYLTHFGPVVDLGAHADAFGWSKERVLAIRDINEENFRIFRTFFYWSQARSLNEFVAIAKREAAIPWANTVAIARSDGRVWYGDIGTVPNVPDELRQACTPALGRVFAGIDADTPFLDGSRSACNWRADSRAPQPGAMPAQLQPSLFRKDYVANMNDSYWLSNPGQPLEGYAGILGGEREALSLRSRLGHYIAQELLAQAPVATRELSRRLRQQALGARVYSAELFKAKVLERVCRLKMVEVTRDLITEQTFTPPRRVDVSPACAALKGWSNTGNAQDRGAHLWEAFWARVDQIAPSELFRVPFSPQHPLNTPRDLNMEDPRVAEAFGAAVLAISAEGLAPDQARGSYLYARSHHGPVPLYGGCEDTGYFTILCNRRGTYRVDGSVFGNSYLQIVSFGEEGMEAYTLLAHGQAETGLDEGRGNEALRRYAEKRWLRFPFSEKDIRREPQLKRVLLRP